MIMEKCNLCPNLCNINRDINKGKCNANNNMSICRIAPHHYEEPIISGVNGSGTIFFSGCSLNCEFCQNFQISKKQVGKTYTPTDLAKAMKDLESQGVHNINLVTPTHYSNKIREALDIYRPKIPIVYNTSGYELPKIIEELCDYVDIFLTDYKYANNDLAYQLSGIKSYTDYCKASLSVMIKNKPLIFNNGLLKQGVIVRHLVLPTYINNSIAVIDDFMTQYIDEAIFSVMSQFIPSYKSSINRTLKPLEYKIVLKKLYSYDTEYCYIQELESASEKYVPDFNFD